MKNAKCVLIIKSFSKNELKDFGKFLTQNIQERNKCRKFFDYIYKTYGKIENERFDSQKVYRYVFPNKAFNLSQLSKLKNEFLQLLEAYILSQYHNQKKTLNQKEEDKYQLEVKRKAALFDFYMEKQIKELWLNTFLEVKESLDNYPFRGEFYYRMKFEINRKARFLATRINTDFLQDYFSTAQRDLDNYYLISSLVIKANDLNIQILCLSLPSSINVLEPIEEKILNSIENEMGIYTWYLSVQFLQSICSFQEIYEHLQKHIDLFLKPDAKILFTFLENFLGKDSPNYKGITRYKKVIDLYDLQLQKGIIQGTYSLVPTLFNNIITVALKLKGEKEKDYIQWAEEFLHKYYKNLILGDSREEQKLKAVIKPYNEARCLWARGKWNDAIEIMNPIIEQDNKGLDAIQKLQIDRLVLKICYELEDTEKFEKSIGKLRTYISRNKESLGEVIVNAHLKMIEVSRQLFDIKGEILYTYKYQPDVNELQTIRDTITQTEHLYEREWLLEKLKEIEN